MRAAGLRARTTAAVVLAATLFLGVAAVVFLALVHRTLVQNVDDAARLRLADVAQLAERGVLIGALADVGDDGTVAQVLDSAGRVLAASPSIRGTAALAPPAPTSGVVVVRTVDRPPIGDGSPYRVAARHLPAAGLDVYAAASLEPVTEAEQAVRLGTAYAAPVLLLVVAGLTWVVVGRSLAPVEAIRRRVASITLSQLDQRVPELATSDEIARLARTMNGMLGRLDDAARRQRAFVSDASHELRSPLATAGALLDVGLARPADTDWPALARRLREQHDRLDRLVDDLLVLASRDEHPRRACEIVHLEELVLREAADARARGRVAVRIDAVDAAPVLGDADGLRRVVRNLVDNAVRHAASAVRLEVGVRGEHAILTVADDGAGISPADHSRVFDRFARLDGARDRARGGTGLGLAIVRDVVRAHGGSIDVSDAAPGARFVVRLPVATGGSDGA